MHDRCTDILRPILCTIRVNVPMSIQTAMQTIQLFVKFANGRTSTVDVKTSDTVQDVFMKLELQERINKKHCYLMFCGKPLHRSSTVRVSECGIRPRSMLHMTTRLHGGMHNTVSFIHSLPMTGLISVTPN